MKKKKDKLKIPRSMKKKFNEKRRLQKSIKESTEKLLQRTREWKGDPDLEFEMTPTSREKMSDIIIDFAAPLLHAVQSYEDQQKAICIAIIIWNLSFLPEADRLNSLKEIENMTSSSTDKDELVKERREIISYFLNRKKHLFPNINRFVHDHGMFPTPGGFHLNIASVTLGNTQTELGSSD